LIIANVFLKMNLSYERLRMTLDRLCADLKAAAIARRPCSPRLLKLKSINTVCRFAVFAKKEVNAGILSSERVALLRSMLSEVSSEQRERLSLRALQSIFVCHKFRRTVFNSGFILKLFTTQVILFWLVFDVLLNIIKLREEFELLC